jgi:very-short-patch-repair endonuclease
LTALARLVSAQHGVLSRAQLRGLGFGDTWIKRRIASGHLIRIYRGVYAVGHAQLTRQGHWMAAVLAGGQGALLSHLSAAAHWGLLHTASSRIDITVPSPKRRQAQAGLRIHRARLDESDCLLHKRIPVTSPSRTLLDLADVVPPNRVREAYEQSERLGRFDLATMHSLIARSPGRRGLKVLRRLLAESQDDPPELRSGVEREFLELIRAAGLPLPATNVVVEGLTVDAYWPRHGLVVELDTYGYHGSRAKFEDDRERTEHLQRAGLDCRRFTGRRVRQQPAAVVATVRKALASTPAY